MLVHVGETRLFLSLIVAQQQSSPFSSAAVGSRAPAELMETVAWCPSVRVRLRLLGAS